MGIAMSAHHASRCALLVHTPLRPHGNVAPRRCCHTWLCHGMQPNVAGEQNLLGLDDALPKYDGLHCFLRFLRSISPSISLGEILVKLGLICLMHSSAFILLSVALISY